MLVSDMTGARLPKAVGLAGSLLVAATVAAQASTVVFSEDFSGAATGTYSTASGGGTGDIGGSQFKVTAHNVDVLGPSLFGCVGNPGGNCVDLIGDQGQGTIESTVGINLHAGDTYTIAYTDVMQGFGPTSTANVDYTVSLGSNLFSENSVPIVTPISIVFTASANETGALLTFSTTSNYDGVHGPVISGITVSQTVAATPLPAALPLFASALGGLGFAGWRRKRRAEA